MLRAAVVKIAATLPSQTTDNVLGPVPLATFESDGRRVVGAVPGKRGVLLCTGDARSGVPTLGSRLVRLRRLLVGTAIVEPWLQHVR